MKSKLRKLRAKYTHRFEDAALDREFVIENNLKASRQAIAGFLFGSVGYACLGPIFWFSYPEFFSEIVLFLYGFVVPTHLFAAAVIHRLGKVYLFQWILVFANLFSGACIIYIILLAPPDFSLSYGYGLIISINIYAFALLRMRFSFALASSFFILGPYYYLAWAYLMTPLDDFIFMVGVTFFINTCGLMSVFFFESYTRHEFMQAKTISQQSAQIEKERQKSEELLLNVLPRKVADRLLSGETTIADLYHDVTVLFADLEGFTALSRRLNAHDLVALLNQIFSQFDQAAQKHGLEKIKTIGDAYMAAAGLPEPIKDHAQRCVAMSLEMLEILKEVNRDLTEPLRLRIGIASGPVVAGVIGRNKFIFDLWGETVNTASRMESSGLPGEIHITEETQKALGETFATTDRGTIEVKGIGPMRTFLIKG